MANVEGLICSEITLKENQESERSNVFVSCLILDDGKFETLTTADIKETVVIPVRANDRGIFSDKNGRKQLNRKSKLFYVSCDYLDVDSPSTEKVRPMAYLLLLLHWCFASNLDM